MKNLHPDECVTEFVRNNRPAQATKTAGNRNGRSPTFIEFINWFAASDKEQAKD